MTPLTREQRERFIAAFPYTQENEPLTRHMYLKIGGPARLFVALAQTDDIVRAIRTAREQKIPWYVFGGGSNILVADEGFEGVMIHMTNRAYSVQEDGRVTAAAGALTGVVARAAADAELAGFEWGIGVPGTIGGATYGNAGCFGGEMKDVVASVEAYCAESDELRTYTGSECGFAYRESRFKHEPHVLFQTTLQLVFNPDAHPMHALEQVMKKRKASQPQGVFSAGCLFKNIEFTDENSLDLLRSRYAVPAEMLAQKRIPAGWLIDKLGLKGTKVGQAQISPIHGNFLVNAGGARANDVLALSHLVKERVRDEVGLLLAEEIQYVGFSFPL